MKSHDVTKGEQAAGRALFAASVLLLSIAALWAVWQERLLPMQDYPQHLLMSCVTTTYDDPAFDWPKHYAINLGWHPYMLWIQAMRPLSYLFGVEAAGKITICVSILLIIAAVIKLARRNREPWGALLLFPFAFHQIYFMGFTNYIIALPILLLCGLDLEEMIGQPFSRWRLLRHLVALAVLMLAHPMAALIYVGWAAAGACAVLKDPASARRALLPAMVMLCAFLVWHQLSPRPFDVRAEEAPTWWPFKGTLQYFLLMFTGMQWMHPEWVSVALWAVAFGTLATAVRFRELKWEWFQFLGTTAAMLLLPFSDRSYSYLNVRLAPAAYFALAMLAARWRVGPGRGAVVAVCAALLLGQSLQTQARLSHESEEILPLAAMVRRNSLVLPIIYDGSPQAVDRLYFHELHNHDWAYLHVLAGGGAGPLLITTPLFPVVLRPDVHLPRVGKYFNWDENGAPYDYILTRAAPEPLLRMLATHAEPLGESGPWVLFENKK